MKNEKNNKKNSGELIYGANPIIEALKAKKRKIISIFTTKPTPKAWARIAPFMPQRPVNIQYVTREKLTKMCGSPDHMGILAWFSSFPYRRQMFDPKKFPMILFIDSVQDVRNLGGILRSAHCTNFAGIVLCENKTAGITAATLKASAGLCEHLEIYKAKSPLHAAKEIEDAGYTMLMAVAGKGKSIKDIRPQGPICLVLGNEEKGISEKVESKGIIITLPQKSSNISYNVSVAAGIAMFTLSFMLEKS